MKLNVKIVGAILVAAVLLLIFFSKTIYSYNLPTVTAVLPTNGTLNKLETVTGIADWADVEEIYAEVGGKINEVLVDEGDKVTSGQPLFTFSFDEGDAERALRELAISKDKLSLDIENIHLKLEKTARNIAELESEAYEIEDVSDYELAQLSGRISKLEEDYERARRLKSDEYEQAKIMHDVGGVAVQELDALQQELEILEYDYTHSRQELAAQYENQRELMAKNEKKEGDAVAEKEKARQKSLQDYRHEIKTLQQDLKAKNLDINNMAIQEEKHRKLLADYSSNMTVDAATDGTVISIPVKKGQHINAGVKLAGLGVGTAYRVDCTVSLENNFITVGDTCKLGNASHTLEGIVTALTPSEGGKQVTVSLESEALSAGETFDVQFEKESADRYTLVPNGAVNKDSDGYFLYQVKRRDGILGKEYYADKLRVYIGDSDNDNTVITKGVTFFEPVVLLSDKPFSANDTLVLGNEGDFFAEE